MPDAAFSLSRDLWDSPLDSRLRAREAGDLFPGSPRPDAAFLAARLAAVRRRAVDRAALAARLIGCHERWNAPPAARAAAASLADPETLLVVTGQQPGLLGGPLYTLHKVATALSVARAWNRLGVARFVPVFWIASDDHDVAEADRLASQGAGGGPRTWRLPLVASGRPLRDVPVPAAAGDLARGYFAAVTSDPEGWLARFAGVPGESICDWFARTLLSLFGGEGLVVLEPGAVLWPAAGEGFARLVAEWPALREEVLRAAAAVGGPEGPPGVPVGPPLFELVGGVRRRVAAETPAARAAVADVARARPDGFSPDVLGRVALQNALLPVAAQVVGPAETAYLPLARPLSEALGGGWPAAVPRASVTWIDPAQEDLLARLGLDVGRLWREAPRYEEAVAARVPAEIRMHLAGVDEAFDGAFLRFADTALSLDPNLAEPFRKGRARVEEEVARLARKVVSAALAPRGMGLSHWESLLGWVRPLGRPQERVYGAMTALARFGIDSVTRTLTSLDPFDFRHRVVVLPRADGCAAGSP